MSVSDTIKNQFANTLKELLNTTPFDKVTVIKICEKSGIGRQTFYNHFKDKYDLASWIYYTETRTIFNDFQHHRDWGRVICLIFCHFLDNKNFYQQIAKDSSQNSFSNYLVKHTRDYYIEAIQANSTNTEIDGELLYTVEFNTYGAVNMSLKWINGGMIEKPEEMSRMMVKNMPQDLRKYMISEQSDR